MNIQYYTVFSYFVHLSKMSKVWIVFAFACDPKTSKTRLFKAMKMCVEGIEKQANKNKLSLVYTITGEKALHKLYDKHIGLKLCENNINSYVMNLKNYKNLDWIGNG